MSETPQKRGTRLKHEIGMDFGNKFPTPLISFSRTNPGSLLVFLLQSGSPVGPKDKLGLGGGGAWDKPELKGGRKG